MPNLRSPDIECGGCLESLLELVCQTYQRGFTYQEVDHVTSCGRLLRKIIIYEPSLPARSQAF
jgi:hypothetical protein